MNYRLFAKQTGLGLGALAVGWTLSTIAYVIVIGRLVWEGELD